MMANTDKSLLLLSGKNNVTANIDGSIIESEDNQVLLGITIESNLSFNKRINNLYKKSQPKAKSSCQDLGLYESAKTWHNNEIIYNISVWLLSIDMNVA